MSLSVAFIRLDLRTWRYDLMVRDRPYKERVSSLDLERASFRLGLRLRSTLEALAPTLEVMEAESFHIKLTDSLVRDCLLPVAGIY
jgi:hypothetical protein